MTVYRTILPHGAGMDNASEGVILEPKVAPDYVRTPVPF